MRLASRNSICMVTIMGLFGTAVGCVERSVVVKVKKDGSGKDAEATPAATEDIGAVDPFADEPRGGPDISFGDIAAQTVLTKALADMRFGLFVEVDGEIHDSNAKHRDGNLLTLISIHVGKVLEDPQAKQRLEKLGGRKASRQEFQQLADSIEGLMVDLQDLIYVSFR